MPSTGSYVGPWETYGEQALAMGHARGCTLCDDFRAHYRAASTENQFITEHSQGQLTFQGRFVDHMRAIGWTVRAPGEGGREEDTRFIKAEMVRYRGERDTARGELKELGKKNNLLEKRGDEYKQLVANMEQEHDRYKRERDEARRQLEELTRPRHDDRGRDRQRSRSPPPPRGGDSYPRRQRTLPSGPSSQPGQRPYRPREPYIASGSRTSSMPAQNRQRMETVIPIQSSASMGVSSSRTTGSQGPTNIIVHLPSAPLAPLAPPVPPAACYERTVSRLTGPILFFPFSDTQGYIRWEP